MLKFKKQYENQSIILSTGLMIDKNSIAKESAQKAMKGNTSFAFMLEDSDPPEQPGTGGGGAGDPRPKPATTTSTKKAKK